jgi:hypothetical protein
MPGKTPATRQNSRFLGRHRLSPSSLIRASGLATIVGGVLFALFPLLHPDHSAEAYASAIWVPVHMMPNVGAILVLFGLVGLLVRQLSRAGLLGIVGFVLAFVGTASFVMGAMIEAFIIPYMGLQNPEIVDGPPPPGVGEAFLIIGVLFGLGHVVLGIATYRAGVVPRGVGLLMVIGALALLLLERIGGIMLELDTLWVVGPVLLGAALVALGYSLWSDRSIAHDERPRRVRVVTPRLAESPR